MQEFLNTRNVESAKFSWNKAKATAIKMPIVSTFTLKLRLKDSKISVSSNSRTLRKYKHMTCLEGANGWENGLT